MEFAAVAIGVVAALAGLIIVLVVLTRVVHVRLLEHGLISSRGVAWLALGVASMAVFGLLHISPLIPLPVALVGVFLLVRDAHRGSRKDN